MKNFTYEVTLSGDEQANFTEIAFFIGLAILVSLIIMIKISRFFKLLLYIYDFLFTFIY